MDFRGRIYKLSSISPTFFKEIRKSIYFSDKEKHKKVEKEVLEIEKKIEKIFSKYVSKIDKIKFYRKEYNLKKKEKISVLWVLISIGQILRKEFGSIVNIDKFIEKGISVINNLENFEKYNDIDDIIYHKEIIDEIFEKKKSYKLISKDATASVYQHLIKKLGAKDDV
jgi:predicted nucleic acid-binding protein